MEGHEDMWRIQAAVEVVRVGESGGRERVGVKARCVEGMCIHLGVLEVDYVHLRAPAVLASIQSQRRDLRILK